MKISNLESHNGNPVPNQFEVRDDSGNVYFQSYQTVICKIDKEGNVTLDPKYKCSNTTSKYRALFLGEDTKTTDRKIQSGEYKVQPLN